MAPRKWQPTRWVPQPVSSETEGELAYEHLTASAGCQQVPPSSGHWAASHSLSHTTPCHAAAQQSPLNAWGRVQPWPCQVGHFT